MNILEPFSKDLANYYWSKKGNSSFQNISNEQLYDSFINFKIKFEHFCDDILAGKDFTQKELCDYIFLSSFISANQYLDYLKRCLFVARSYLYFITQRIDKDNIQKYIDSLQMIRIDYEELIANVEVNIIKSSPTIELTSGRTKFKQVIDIWRIANSLF